MAFQSFLHSHKNLWLQNIQPTTSEAKSSLDGRSVVLFCFVCQSPGFFVFVFFNFPGPLFHLTFLEALLSCHQIQSTTVIFWIPPVMQTFWYRPLFNTSFWPKGHYKYIVLKFNQGMYEADVFFWSSASSQYRTSPSHLLLGYVCIATYNTHIQKGG